MKELQKEEERQNLVKIKLFRRKDKNKPRLMIKFWKRTKTQSF